MRKFKHTNTLILGLGIAFFTLSNCTKDKAPFNPGNLDCPTTISFNQQILPMIQNNCISCHDSGLNNPTLTNYAQVAANANDISGTLHGQPVLMPDGGPALPDTLIQQFSCWIQQGKLNN